MNKKKNKYTIIVDTREQCPIIWKENDNIAGTIVKKLDVGDYSILGLETVISIERKGSCSEFAKNILESRFFRELQKLNDNYKYAFLLFSKTKSRCHQNGKMY